MDEDRFSNYLIKGGRSTTAVNRCLTYVAEFEDFLKESNQGKTLDEAQGEDLVDYVLMLDASSNAKAKKHLWAIRYYYDYALNAELRDLTASLREERIDRKPFPLKEFRGVDPGYIEKLAIAGIENVVQMLAAGETLKDRELLARNSGIPQSAVLEYVKLSDLARIPGVKGIRARLYYDAGIDTVAKLAILEPEELCKMVLEYVEISGFDGQPTLPAEAKYTVEKARKLSLIVEY